MSKSSSKSVGVEIFGILIIFSSIIHMQKLVLDVASYVHWYSYMPPWMITLRYGFSWFQRIVGILVGVGILARKDIARKAGIGLGCFTIATVYWKHPYAAFKIHTQELDQVYGNLFSRLGLPAIKFASVTLLADIVHCLLDILFWGIFIYLFTRPSVKEQFKVVSLRAKPKA